MAASDPVAMKGRSQAEIRAQFTERLDAAAAAGPADEAACHKALDVWLCKARSGYEVRGLLYVVEAVLGTEAVIQYVLQSWESTDPAELSQSASGVGTLALDLAPLLLRLTPEAHADALTRLTALRDALIANWPYGTYERSPKTSLHHHLAASLDLVLGGTEAMVQMQVRAPHHAVLCEDGPFLSGFFTALTGAKWTSVAPRAAFVAPEAVIVHYTRCYDEYTRAEQQQELVEVLSTLADPRIVPWMFHMTMGTKARAAAKAWFVEHADETADYVRSQRDDPNGPYRAGAEKLAKAMKI